MLRTAAGQLSNILRGAISARVVGVQSIRASHGGNAETDEQFDARYEAYFSRPEIDGWEVRKGMNDILGMDLVPDPKIIISALKACRRINDFALTVRWLEGVKDKCGDHKDIFAYVSKEIRPTLDELGVPTLEEIGYDTPELALKTVFEQ